MKITTIIIVSMLAGIIGGIGAVGGAYWFVTTNTNWLSDNGVEVIERKEVQVSSQNDAVVAAVKSVRPAVVSISEKLSATNVFGQIVQTEAAGTGFVVTADGLILTNKHVVETAGQLGTDFTIVTSDGKSYAAVVKAVDPSNDLAILKIEADNLPVAKLGYSDVLELGQTAIAIGNAQGQFPNSVTTGIISGIDRAITATDGTGSAARLEGLIQTDAAINEGNSGGPLIDLAGNVIGINTAMDAGAQQIGFALPINLARGALDSYLANNAIIRPRLGVRTVSITPDFAKANNLAADHGALIYSNDIRSMVAVLPGSAAEKAGLKVMDIIIKIENKTVDENHSLATLLQEYKPGDTVTLTILRDGSEQATDVILDKSE